MKLYIIIALFFFSACGGSEQTNPESVAFSQAKEYLKSIVKDPASFDGGHAPNSIVPMGDSIYIVNASFKSQNGFGATITSEYHATMHYKGGDVFNTGSWEVQELIIDNKKVK